MMSQSRRLNSGKTAHSLDKLMVELLRLRHGQAPALRRAECHCQEVIHTETWIGALHA